LNPTRTGLLEILRDMGGVVAAEARGDELGEPIGDIHAGSAELRAIRTGGEVVTRAIDEIPVLCALAARASGSTEILDAAELRVKESDRLAAMASVLRSFEVEVDERPDGLVIHGQPDKPLRAPRAPVPSRGDHRVAMTAAVLGLVADGPTRVTDVACIATSFPRFAGTLRALGAEVEFDGSDPSHASRSAGGSA
jgi:3-phosphoshikimate 1-carboxyvinyltransferase